MFREQKSFLPTDLALQPDGGIVVVGGAQVCDPTCHYFLRMMRVTSQGLLDRSFGENRGFLDRPRDPADAYLNRLAIGPGGDITLVGSLRNCFAFRDNCVYRGSVLRLTSSGRPDSTFGKDGEAILGVPAGPYPPGPSFPLQAVAVAPDGRVLAGGLTAFGGGQGSFLVRLDARGELDPSFAGDGTAELATPLDDIRVEANGRILAGSAFGSTYGVSALDSDGTPDLGFGGGDGEVVESVGTEPGGFVRGGMELAAGGQIVLAGPVTRRCGQDGSALCAVGANLLRLTPSGALDPTFGTGGFSTVDRDLAQRDRIAERIDLGLGTDRYYLSSTSSSLIAALGLTGSIESRFGRGGLLIDPPVIRCANRVAEVGTPGPDRIFGTDKFADFIATRGGPDLIVSGDLPDVICGGSGDDRFRAGDDDDLLIGGPGRDRLNGGSGNDLVKALDGERDVIDCRRGSDRVFADRFDRLLGCESVDSGRR